MTETQISGTAFPSSIGLTLFSIFQMNCKFFVRTGNLLPIIFFFSFFSSAAYSQNHTISGYLYDRANGEALIGANVYIKGTSKGAMTNVYGFYSLSLPQGTHEIVFSYIGYEAVTKIISLTSDSSFTLKLNMSESVLREVTITAESRKEAEEVRSTQMSMIKIPIEQITGIPTIGGEADIIKVMQLLPGVKRGGEGATGMFVRGGDADQNLILLDEAVVYNVSHLFGFFSVFNNDVLKDVTMIKGGFPANYGGRLSSVLDIRMKEGNAQQFKVDGGVGLLSSRLTVQGPIIKDTMSFILSGRRSYIDQVFRVAYGQNVLPYYFYDLNGKLNYKISDKDRLYLSAYRGDDVLKFEQQEDSSLLDFGFLLGNFTTTLRWNHLYHSKLFSNISLIHTSFRYDVEGSFVENSVLIRSSISDFGIKADYEYYKSTESQIRYGGSFTNHNFRPNVVSTSGEISKFLKSKKGAILSTQDLAGYALHDYSITPLLKVNYGTRFSGVYAGDTFYTGIEPRLSATYLITETNSVKAGFSRMKQYMHLVSSSSIALPTDLWYPVTRNVRPQTADQAAVGYTHHVKKIKSMLTVEAYYKWMKNLVEYRPGAVLILNDNFENELISGKGNAYGLEFFLNRQEGRLTGWIGYTISWANRKFAELNNNEWYFAKYDRRHDVSFVGMYELSKRWDFSAVWVFSSGSRFTPIVGNFFMPNATMTKVDILPIYTSKNAIALPSSHRLDINFVLKSKEKRKWKSEWHFGAYNFYNRAQPYRVEITPTDGGYKYTAVGLFGFIPSVAFNFKF